VPSSSDSESKVKVVIVGAGGRLGAALVRQYHDKFDVIGFNHAQLDLGDGQKLRDTLGALSFDILINAAAFTNVDLCEKEIDQAFLINAGAPKLLAQICRHKKAKLIHISTDYVFDGEKRQPYTEEDIARPISVYAESKREGEKLVLQIKPDHLVVRVSWVFGPDRPSFVDGVIKRAREQEYVEAIADKFATPTYTLDIAEMLPQFFDGDLGGILHFANAGECSWQQYAQHAIDCCHSLDVPLKAKTVGALRLADMKNFIARRPVYSVLSTAKYAARTGAPPRSWRDAVAEYVRDHVRV
jgi:dTDP-4-dehydrorhamnose reductase